MWFTPLCDQILYKVAFWYNNYSNGIVYSSKAFLNYDGRVVDKPTIYSHKLIFTKREIDYLELMLKAANPKSVVTQNISKVAAGIKKGILVPPNGYKIELAYYPQDVKEIYDTLINIKSGNVSNIGDLVTNQKEKAPFEM